MTDAAIDQLYSTIDALLRAGKFAAVDEMLLLATLDADQLSVTLLLGYLSITLAARDELTERSPLAVRIRARLEREEPERVATLLAGIE